jgi:outer membrane protein assembly factor BamB
MNSFYRCLRQLPAITLLTMALGFSTRLAKGEDWPQWLGSSRDAVWREGGIVNTFKNSTLKPVWRQKIGGGYSGPSVAGGKVYVMDRISTPYSPATEEKGNKNFIRADIEGNERILCLDERTGAIVWKHEYDRPYTSVYLYAIGPRCTPTVEGDRVYTLGAEGDLLCLDANRGKVIWSRHFNAEFSTKTPAWGYASHPLVDGKKLICMVGGKDSTVVAFDKTSGEELWRSGSAREPGYCPPVIYEIAGQRQLITWDSDAVRGLDPETGGEYWRVPLPPTYGMSIGMPRLEGQRLFVMSFSRLSAMIELDKAGRKAVLGWKATPKMGIGGVLDTAWVENGHVYGSGHRGYYTCAQLATGQRLWETNQPTRNIQGQRATSWPSTFTIKHEPSGRFFLANDHGELILAEMDPSGYREISRASLIDPTHQVGGRQLVWSHPAFANRRVYARNDREIVCVDLAEE